MMNVIKKSLDQVSHWFTAKYAGWRDDLDSGPRWIRWLLIPIGVYLLFAIFVGIHWNWKPGEFSVTAINLEKAQQAETPIVTGSATTATLIHMAEILLEKPGGFISNDILPPGVWLDNISNWEYGVLIQMRDASKAMREAFSRSQSQSKEDRDLSRVEPRFNFDHQSWAIPASESQYEEAIEFLSSYYNRLLNRNISDAQFYARADNLNYWLQTVETRLGSLSQRLSASVGQRRINTDLAGDSAATQSTPAPQEIEAKTPWLQIDDIFYEARGTTWALVHLLKAVEIDFEEILKRKNALVSLRQIIRELESSQETVYSPIILNGSGFGLVANHSLVMASYISRANAAIIDLRELLSRG